MYRHLVTIEVRVVGTACQRMKANGLALDQGRLESLDGKAVKRWSTVQQNRVLFGYFLKHVPNFGCLALDQFFGRTNGMHITKILEPSDDEGLEQYQRHLLRETALVKFQFRTDHDH